MILAHWAPARLEGSKMVKRLGEVDPHFSTLPQVVDAVPTCSL